MVLPATSPVCAACRHPQRRPGVRCEMCGAPLDRPGSPPSIAAPHGAPAPEVAPRTSVRFELEPMGHERQRGSRSRALQFLLIGIPLAALFELAPLVQFMGWFLGSLFHESGHTLAGWFMGHPTVPKISLEGHAAATHGEAMWVVRAAVLAAAGSLLWSRLRGGRRVAALGGLGVVYALLLCTSLGEVLFLTSGHLGELAMGGLCLWRAATEEACHHDGERAAYATLGWYLMGRNLVLSFGLAFSASARAEYATSGSFGLTNDYLRLAQEHLGSGVEVVGVVSGLTALAFTAAALAMGLRASASGS